MLDEVEKTGYKIPTPREEAIKILVDAIQPKKSHTFRSGKTGGWLPSTLPSSRNPPVRYPPVGLQHRGTRADPPVADPMTHRALPGLRPTERITGIDAPASSSI